MNVIMLLVLDAAGAHQTSLAAIRSNRSMTTLWAAS